MPFNASGPDAAPMAEVVAACRRKGVLVFSHFNRIHVAPPLVTSTDDLLHGVSVIDEALSRADACTVTGAR